MKIVFPMMLPLILLVLTKPVSAAEKPDLASMWQMIQTQQRQIEALERANEQTQARLKAAVLKLQSADSLLLATQSNREALQSQQGQLVEALSMIEATADVIEGKAFGSKQDKPVFGGYGELHYNNIEENEEFDLHRFVLFTGYQFRDDLRFYSELEVEHSIAGEGKKGEIELEQAFVQWDYRGAQHAKMGVFLMPVGILNETHEPDTFYGVERNSIERNIIPATWWEAGVALGGEIAPGWSYDFAVSSGLNLDTDNASAAKRSSLRSARQKASEANGDALAYTGRLSFTGMPGFQWQASLQYQSDLTQDDADGIGINSIDATLFETHISLDKGGFGLRALYARWDIDNEINLLDPGSDEQFGWYVEPSWRINPNLGLFARYGVYDLNAGSRTNSNEKSQWDIGLNYWLHENVVVKLDYQSQGDEKSADRKGFNLGVGYSF